MSSPTTKPESGGLVNWLAANRGRAGIFLAVLGAAILVVPVLLVAYYHWDFLPVVISTGALGLLVIAVGVMLNFLAAEEGDADRVRMLVLVLGGCGGLLIAVSGASLSYLWWNYLTNWLRDEDREGVWRILVALLTILAGLAVMFAALQTARAEERTNPALRRLVFGYNAVLSGVLLLILLAVVNAFVSARYTTAIESVDRGDTSLSERGLKVAKALERPVRFYVIWPTDDDLVYPLRGLLSNLEDASPQVHVQYLSPGLDRQAISDLNRKYPGKIQEGRGVLVVKGEEKPENATFLRDTDLYEQEMSMRGASSELKFKGEDRIIAALMSDKAVVYVTQGNGEPDLNDASPHQIDRGLGVLKDRLNARGNFDVRALTLNPADPKVPPEAGLVIVANPRPPIGAALQRALRDYLIARRGKAVFLVDIPPAGGDEKTIPPTGWEGLLGEFGVEVTNERIFSEPVQQNFPPDFVLLQVAPELGNDLSRTFRRRPVLGSGVRVVRPARMPGNPMLRAEPLLTTIPGISVWTETDVTADRDRTWEEMDRNPAARKRLSPAPLPAAVVVSETAPQNPMGGAPPAAKPRLVVFGDATFVTNPFVAEGLGSANFAFFASTLDWLSERPTSVGAGARSLKYYSLDATTSPVALVFLPGVIALVVILGLGLGVWTVRRR